MIGNNNIVVFPTGQDQADGMAQFSILELDLKKLIKEVQNPDAKKE